MTTTTTKKTTTSARSKTTAKPKVAPEKEETKVGTAVAEGSKKQKRVFKQDDGIPCRSITQGGLFMEGAKTKMVYEWSEYGDITYVEYADLASAVRVRSSYIFSPCFMIDDDDFVEEFPQLKKFYTENYSVNDLETILSYPVDRMIEEIGLLPKTAIESLKVMSASAISDGTLDSVAKIKALDDFFGTNLSLLAEFRN